MANVVKIYEIKTYGYDQVSKELTNVNKLFEAIKKTKQELDRQKLNTSDKTTLQNLNAELKEAKIKTAELRLERQRLINEAKVLQNLQQAQINASRQATSAITAEAGSYNDLVNKLKLLNALRKNLAPESGTTISFGTETLNFEQARARAAALNQQIQALGFSTRSLGDVGNQASSLLSRWFTTLKSQLGVLVLQYAGWMALFRETSQLINENIKLSDSFADLQIRIKGTSADVQTLFNELKKIDTRTSLKNLVDIANVIAKKGVPKEDIAALTAEFDKLNVVLGSEIGEPGTATANIIKLITIFNDDKQVTAERIREIGTELFKLTTTGVATGEFLVNFAERVGAVRGITGLTLPQVLGLGAALQQLGQRTEVAGTAAVQLVTRLFTDVPKFAKAAKKDVEEFRKILQENPFEALVQVAEGLKSLGDGELQENFEEVVQAFGEVGVVGVRIKAVLGDIATNGKFVRDRMAEASTTSKDFARQTDAVELKQHTFAATLARVRKEFELIGTNRTVQVFLATIGSLILFLVGNLGTIITVLGIYASAWVIANSAMISARIATIASNAAFTVQYAWLVIITTWTRAYTAALSLFTGATTGATAATRLLSIALRLLPIGLILGLLALLVAGCQRVASGVRGTTAELRKQADQLEFNREVTKRVNETVAKQVTEYEALVRVITASTTSYDTARSALDKLIQMNGRFSAALKNNVIDANELKKALDEVKSQILLNAKVTAGQELVSDKYKQYFDVVATRQRFEFLVAQSKTGLIQIDDLSKIEGGLIKKFNYENSIRANRNAVTLLKEDANIIIEGLKKIEEERFESYNNYQSFLSNLQAQKIDLDKKQEVQNEKLIAQSLEGKIKQGQVDKLSINELQDIIKQIEKTRDTLKEGDPKLEQLRIARDKFQTRLDALQNNKTKPDKPYRGARLSGEDKDRLAEIDAEYKKALAQAEAGYSQAQIAFVDGQKQLRTLSFREEVSYLNDIRDINNKFLDEKIQYLQSQGNLNAKEQQTLANFLKEKYDLEVKYYNDIQALNDKEFNRRKTIAKEQLEEDIANAKLEYEKIDSNPALSNTYKAQAKLDTDRKILKLQEDFNKYMDYLEKALNQTSKKNTKEGAEEILRTKKEIIKDQRDVIEAEFKDIQDAQAGDIANIEIRFAKMRQAILANDKLTIEQRERALRKLEALHNYTILTAELNTLRIEFEKIQELYDKKLISEKEYLQKKAELEKKRADQKQAGEDLKVEDIDLPSSSSSQKILTDRLAKLFGFAKGSGEFQLLGQAISEAYSLASDAMRSYFDAEEERIRRNLQLYEERLDREKEQVKARAQSQAEIESIEKQYAAKKLKAEREAGEKLKKIKRAEAKIALATELANIAVAAAANPANGPTFGVAGIIMYAILSALALARYSLNVSNINREQFRYGGGITKGRTHEQGGEQFLFKGRVYEDEVDEINVIRTKDANPNTVHTISGTQTQIASMLNKIGGGIDFSPGAKAYKFAQGGILGSNYQAPVAKFTGSAVIDLESYLARVNDLIVEQSNRIDRIQVVQETRTVSDALTKQVKQETVGSL